MSRNNQNPFRNFKKSYIWIYRRGKFLWVTKNENHFGPKDVMMYHIIRSGLYSVIEPLWNPPSGEELMTESLELRRVRIYKSWDHQIHQRIWRSLFSHSWEPTTITGPGKSCYIYSKSWAACIKSGTQDAMPIPKIYCSKNFFSVLFILFSLLKRKRACGNGHEETTENKTNKKSHTKQCSKRKTG